MIGLSLSFCVKDILDGRVIIDQVGRIITSTCAYNDERWAQLISGYSQSYWADYSADTINGVLARLRPIIEQPRIDNKPHPNIARGHWVENESQITWMG
jgi:hypothetical protein